MQVKAFKCDQCGAFLVWPKDATSFSATRHAEKAGWEVSSPGDFDLCGPCRFAPAKATPDAPAAVPVIELDPETYIHRDDANGETPDAPWRPKAKGMPRHTLDAQAGAK